MITIRHATDADVEQVFELISAIADHHGQSHFVLTDTAELRKAGFGDHPKYGVLLAEYRGRVAGFVSYTIAYSIWLGRQYMHIDDVFVDSKFRGKHIGKSLMLEARKYSESLGISRIKWEIQKDNHRAKSFYERLGAEYYEKGVFAWDWSE